MYRPTQLVEMQIASCEARALKAKEDYNSEGGSAFDRERMKDANDEKMAWKAVQNLMQMGRQFENPKSINQAPLDRRILLCHPMRGWITGQWIEDASRWYYHDEHAFGVRDSKANQPLVFLELPH